MQWKSSLSLFSPLTIKNPFAYLGGKSVGPMEEARPLTATQYGAGQLMQMHVGGDAGLHERDPTLPCGGRIIDAVDHIRWLHSAGGHVHERMLRDGVNVPTGDGLLQLHTSVGRSPL